MPRPEGSLTAAQYEILEVVWAHEANGATVAEIWEEIADRRDVGRTTILNLVDRLEKRGWLVRRAACRPSRYLAALDRQSTVASLAGSLVDDFFEGSARDLVLSLLGSERLRSEEVQSLRRYLDSAAKEDRSRKGR